MGSELVCPANLRINRHGCGLFWICNNVFMNIDGEEHNLGLGRDNVELSKYHPGWKKAFEEAKKAIQKELGNKVLGVEHIGSTAVPGMIAKPILDFMVAVGSIDNYKEYIAPLSKLGYEFRRDNRIRNPQEHILFSKGPVDLRTQYLKLTQKDSQFWKESILFRDYLIAYSDIAKEYQQLKEKLQASHRSNREAYTEAKAEFIQRILKLAQGKR